MMSMSSNLDSYIVSKYHYTLSNVIMTCLSEILLQNSEESNVAKIDIEVNEQKLRTATTNL